MDLLRHINWVDVLALIIIIRISYVSLGHGLSHELFALFGVYLNTLLVIHYYLKMGFLLSEMTGIPRVISTFVSFLFLLVAISFIVLFGRRIVDFVVKVSWNPVIERVGGILSGIARACLTVSLVLMLMMVTPLPYLQWSVRDRSLTGMFFLRIGPAAYAKTYALVPGLMKKSAALTEADVMSDLTSDKILPAAPHKAEPPRGE